MQPPLLDSQSEYIKHFLEFIGITDIEFVYAKELNTSKQKRGISSGK
jgi:FMN-dependent NADH-azoreductase